MPIQVRLIVVGGKASKADVALKLPSVIGRSREAGLTIAHPMVSRRHCEVFEAEGLMMIRDLGSLNGTLVAGKRIKESPLPPDSEFTVGPLTFRTQYQCERDLSKLPPPVLAEQEVAIAAPSAPVESPRQTRNSSTSRRRPRRRAPRRRQKKRNQSRRPRPRIDAPPKSTAILRPHRSPSPRRRPSKSRWLKKNLKSNSRLSKNRRLKSRRKSRRSKRRNRIRASRRPRHQPPSRLLRSRRPKSSRPKRRNPVSISSKSRRPKHQSPSRSLKRAGG